MAVLHGSFRPIGLPGCECLAADAGGADFDDHFQGPGDFRLSCFREFEGLVVADYADDFRLA